MTTKSPVIKFSPFEALLIGEKNKVLKRQPMKNTIFITRINHQNKAFNLRDLFDLEKDTSKSENEDVIFKVPQRVRDFLNSRKLISESNNVKKKEDNLYFAFERQKVVIKKDDRLVTREKNSKSRANKIKFKKKFNFKNNFEGRPVRKFYSHARKTKYNRSKSRQVLSRLLVKNLKTEKCCKNRHLLRGKDGKFISKKDYQNLESKDDSTKQRYLSDYVHQLYLNKNSFLYNDSELDKKENLNEIQAQFTTDSIVSLQSVQLMHSFDITAPENLLNEISKKYYDSNCKEDFQFPKFPDSLQKSNFDDDENLLDIIYENFPKVRFESEDIFNDFSDALRNAGILAPEKSLKMYEKKKNVFFNSEKLTVIFNNHIPYIDLRRLENPKSITYPYKNGRNTFRSIIDEPHTKKTHLITTKSFECLFLRSTEGKEIFLGNLMKPFWQNSWFGTLPKV